MMTLVSYDVSTTDNKGKNKAQKSIERVSKLWSASAEQRV